MLVETPQGEDADFDLDVRLRPLERISAQPTPPVTQIDCTAMGCATGETPCQQCWRGQG